MSNPSKIERHSDLYEELPGDREFARTQAVRIKEIRSLSELRSAFRALAILVSWAVGSDGSEGRGQIFWARMMVEEYNERLHASIYAGHRPVIWSIFKGKDWNTKHMEENILRHLLQKKANRYLLPAGRRLLVKFRKLALKHAANGKGNGNAEPEPRPKEERILVKDITPSARERAWARRAIAQIVSEAEQDGEITSAAATRIMMSLGMVHGSA